MAAVVKLGYKSIGDMENGKIGVAFDNELKRVVADLNDRPGLKKPRKVMLQITFMPVGDQGVVDSVNFGVQIKSNVPEKKSKVYSAGISGVDTLVVNEDSPDNWRQGTLNLGTGEVIDKQTGEVNRTNSPKTYNPER